MLCVRIVPDRTMRSGNHNRSLVGDLGSSVRIREIFAARSARPIFNIALGTRGLERRVVRDLVRSRDYHRGFIGNLACRVGVGEVFVTARARPILNIALGARGLERRVMRERVGVPRCTLVARRLYGGRGFSLIARAKQCKTQKQKQ